MADRNRPRVAVIGAGHRGRGWAALALSRGWSVSLYDLDSGLLQRASDDVGERVRRLTDLGRADPLAAAGALDSLRVGRSLLHAVGDAELVFDVMPLDLAGKQRLVEQIEQVARVSAITVSITATMHSSALCARLRRPERHLVAHALDPVEMTPLVEIVPSSLTDADCTEQVRAWFEELDRKTVILKREVAGNATGRILAAVWRECIDLVLEGVVDLVDVDRLVSLGPAIEWATAGPHLTQVMGAGARGTGVFLSEALQEYERVWSRLARWDTLAPEDRQRLIRLIERVYDEEPSDLRAERDRFLARLLRVIEPHTDVELTLDEEPGPPGAGDGES
jgi:3-hydroxyacyl-CoA dehydrogenase